MDFGKFPSSNVNRFFKNFCYYSRKLIANLIIRDQSKKTQGLEIFNLKIRVRKTRAVPML